MTHGRAYARLVRFSMRITVEIRPEQRIQLLEIAARRGKKGFSGLVQEAIDRFLDHEPT
jgi:hypothetical protein